MACFTESETGSREGTQFTSDQLVLDATVDDGRETSVPPEPTTGGILLPTRSVPARLFIHHAAAGGVPAEHRFHGCRNRLPFLLSARGPKSGPILKCFAELMEPMGSGSPVTAGMHTNHTDATDAIRLLSGPVRDWFAGAFPAGPTPAADYWPGRESPRASICCWSRPQARKRRRRVPGDPRPLVP